MAMPSRLAAATFLAVALLSPAAHAQSRSTQARDHVRAGLAYAEHGKWEEALREFEEAYALEPQPLRLYDVAQARFKTNRFRAAAEAYKQLIDAPSLTREQHDRVRAGLASAREKIARVKISVANAREGDVVTLDGAPVSQDTVVDLDPGHHVARVVRDGEATESSLDLEPGATLAISLVARTKEDAGAPPPAAPRAKKDVPTLTWVLAGTSVVALSAGTYFGLVGLNKYDRLADDPCAAKKTCGRAEFNSMRTHLVLGDALITVGVLAAGAAFVVWIVSRTGPPEPKVEKVVRFSPRLGGGALAISF